MVYFLFSNMAVVFIWCVLMSYAVSHARRSGTAAAGVAKYYHHVQTGLWRTGSSSKPGESLITFEISFVCKRNYMYGSLIQLSYFLLSPFLPPRSQCLSQCLRKVSTQLFVKRKGKWFSLRAYNAAYQLLLNIKFWMTKTWSTALKSTKLKFNK